MKSSLCALFAFAALVPLRAASPVSVERRFEQMKKSPPELYAFLLRMPKGGDLHNHLAGAVYAESFIRAAAENGLCIDKTHWRIIAACTPGDVNEESAREASRDQFAYNALIDTFSMRDFVPGREAPQDHFFDSFPLFEPADKGHTGEFVAELARRAADQNESYLELMALDGGGVLKLGAIAGSIDNFQEAAERLKAAGLGAAVAEFKQKVDEIERQRRETLHCDAEPDSAACRVVVRYIYQVLREFPKEQVFAQTLVGFELASIDPRVVAVNFVQPEHGIISMRDYHLHMQMVDFAKSRYPKVHVTLHAGELASGLVPPEGLRFHVREAIELAHAERIGHGTDIMYETGAVELLKEMRRKQIAVEIALSSSDKILGVKGLDHPFPVYRRYGVPVVLATDDEGVNRSHMTQEFQRAVLTYDLGYADLKQLVRNSLEYSFLSGASYWKDPGYRVPADACAGGLDRPKCKSFLESSNKAAAQAELEKRFDAFETNVLKD